MLRSVKEMMGYKIQATDDEVGRVSDFYFDDMTWVIRYMVADTGTWLPGRRVLISPSSMQDPEWKSRTFPVDLLKSQIENSPAIDKDQPVSKQMEQQLAGFYGWPIYWTTGPFSGSAAGAAPADPETVRAGRGGDHHLRSVQEVLGYHIHASDGEVGHVEDFVVEVESWTLRYLAVDTRNWLPGRKVLVSPQWIERVSWQDVMVYVDLTRDSIENSPEYDPKQPVNREYEERLYDYYGRPRYWK